MRCPNHPQNEVTGYCHVCGNFGCADCLTAHEGNMLCAKHYKPIGDKLEEGRRQEEARRKHPRKLLVVRYQDGRREFGVAYGLNLRETGFHLDLVQGDGTPLGRTKLIRFQELKAVFVVKSFDGKYDKKLRYREWAPEGEVLTVKFKDGEVIKGKTLQAYDPLDARFYLVPEETETNNLSVIVERANVAAVYTEEEYEEKLAMDREAAMENGGSVTLSQEETTGDFYFETRNYPAALEQYKLAVQKHPEVKRLQKKILLVYYNIGIDLIKRREYPKALQYMEFILKSDPRNPRVLKKASQLRHIIEKEGKARATS